MHIRAIFVVLYYTIKIPNPCQPINKKMYISQHLFEFLRIQKQQNKGVYTLRTKLRGFV